MTGFARVAPDGTHVPYSAEDNAAITRALLEFDGCDRDPAALSGEQLEAMRAQIGDQFEGLAADIDAIAHEVGLEFDDDCAEDEKVRELHEALFGSKSVHLAVQLTPVTLADGTKQPREIRFGSSAVGLQTHELERLGSSMIEVTGDEIRPVVRLKKAVEAPEAHDPNYAYINGTSRELFSAADNALIANARRSGAAAVRIADVAMRNGEMHEYEVRFGEHAAPSKTGMLRVDLSHDLTDIGRGETRTHIVVEVSAKRLVCNSKQKRLNLLCSRSTARARPPRHELDDGEDSERRLALALAKELVSTIEASPEPHAALDLVDKVRRALLAIPDEPPARVEGEIDGASSSSSPAGSSCSATRPASSSTSASSSSSRVRATSSGASPRPSRAVAAGVGEDGL